MADITGTPAKSSGSGSGGAALTPAQVAALALAHAQNTDARLSLPLLYAAPLAAGQVVLVEGGQAKPVTSRTAAAVSGALGVVLTVGAAGTRAPVALLGQVAAARFNFPAGPVSLGTEGFPVAGWPTDGGHYVPLGFSPGGGSFVLNPPARFFSTF